MLKNVRNVVAAMGLVFAASSASAVTQLIHFDDANNGAPTYTTADGNFFFNPTNLASGNCADSTNGGNGSCVHEVGNGVVTDMTRLTGDNTFSLLSFYVSVQGTGSTNYFSIFDGTITHQFDFGTTYANMTNYPDGTAAGAISQNGKYIVDVSGLSGFDDITKVTWAASSTARVRIDCIAVSFDGTTTDPYDANTQCGLDGGGGGGTGLVPLPAGLPLLLSALGIVGIVRRRARKSA